VRVAAEAGPLRVVAEVEPLLGAVVVAEEEVEAHSVPGAGPRIRGRRPDWLLRERRGHPNHSRGPH